MSIQITVFFVLSFYLSLAFAKLDFKTCSSNGLAVIYINGVLTDRQRAVEGAQAVRDVLIAKSTEKYDQKGVIVNFVYNPSTVVWKEKPNGNESPEGGELDYWECVALKAREISSKASAGVISSLFGIIKNERLDSIFGRGTSEQITSHFTNYDPILDFAIGPEGILAEAQLEIKTKEYFQAGYKVIHIAHSQGGFIASNVAGKINAGRAGYTDKDKYYGAIFLGTPISFLPVSQERGKFSYLSSDQDIIVRGLRLGRGSLIPNIDVPILGDTPSVDGHSIVNTYLTDQRIGKDRLGNTKLVVDHVRDLLRDSVATLDNNSISCCNRADGKLWVNESGCADTKEACDGGFLEKTVKLNLLLDDELELSKDSVICGDVKIETNRSIVKIDDSKLIGPATIKGDVELKNVKLEASAANLNHDRALFDGEEQMVKIDFTGSTFLQPNILGRPQIIGPVEITSSKSEAVITGSPIIRNDVKLFNSKLKEVSPPADKTKKVTSPIVIDGEFGEVVLSETSLEGKVDITGPVVMTDVTQTGSASVQRASLYKTKLSNNYYSLEKPGIQISKDPLCSNELNIGEADIRSEADIRACGGIFDDAVIQGHVQVRGEVALGGKLLGEIYNSQFEPMKILGSADPDFGIVTGPLTEIYNRPTIEGDLVIDGTTKIFDNGSYKGVKQLVEPGVTYFSNLAGGTFTGTNDISGFYYISKGLDNSTVQGEYANFGDGTWLSTNVLSSATILGRVSLKGPLSLEGTVGDQAVLEGQGLGSAGGVYIKPTASFVGIGKKLKGGVLLDANTVVVDSDINGSEIDLYTPKAIMHIDGSTIENSSLNGIGRITGSYLFNNATGAGNSYYIDTSSMNGGSISGNSNLISSTATNSSISSGATIFSATINSLNASNGAYLCNRTYNGGSYGSGYNCEDEEGLRKRNLTATEAWTATAQRSTQIVKDAQAKIRRELQASKRRMLSRMPAGFRKKVI